MLTAWVVFGSAIAYIGFLFAVASFGDRARGRPVAARRGGRPVIYALSLAVYCTSWTFFGSVGLAASSGLQFLTIYLGPILMMVLGYPLLLRILRLAKTERITSIADFVAARYGKNPAVAQVATLIAVVGAVPYIALQLKAVSTSVLTLVDGLQTGASGEFSFFGDISLLVALSMAAFAILFGTRHVDATEHQEGLMLAIATESVIKLVAFLTIGIFVTFGVFDGPGDLLAAAAARPGTLDIFAEGLDGGAWLAMTLLSLFAIILLPRQFHVTVVENNSPRELALARWLFPLYLVLINLFVVPIALAGMVRLGGTVDADNFVVALPMAADSPLLTLVAFVGGLSAATAMVILACVALAIMISNDIVMPLILRRGDAASTRDLPRRVLTVRRTAIVVIMILAYLYYRVTGGTAALASIGLLSFAAVAQLAPAFFGGLFWRRATARGALAGMIAGFAVWAYTLLLPVFAQSGLLPAGLIESGPFGLGFLRPQGLLNLGLDPLPHGVFWSLLVNLVAYVGGSLMREPEPVERLQANIFAPAERMPAPVLRLWRTDVSTGDLIETATRFLGAERANRAFAGYAEDQRSTLDPEQPADPHVLRFTEQLLASAIGASSARLVLSLLLKRRDPSTKGALKLLDEASAAIQYSRDLMQIALDQVGQGIAVFDRDLRLVFWNRQFRTLLDLPVEFGQVAMPLDQLLRHMAGRGDFGADAPEVAVTRIVEALAVRNETFEQTVGETGTVLEARTNPMPDGGIVVTYSDITQRARAGEELERRVRERTEELTRVNLALSQAKAAADEANIGKTRFLAAAAHDIAQPLNAARLYTTTVVERLSGGSDRSLVGNIDASLEAVEEIIGAVLDISRLDAGALKPEFTVFRLGPLLSRLATEFAPLARERGLELIVVPSSLAVRSDRALLRRLLQNLVSNAVKYTPAGRILVGCRRRGSKVVISVHDTGLGIPADKRRTIFQEFQRLDSGARQARGLGLGLSIVERIGRVLGHPIAVESTLGRGSHFSVTLPIAAATVGELREAEPAQPAVLQRIGLKLLAVDNDERILEGMRTLLSGWGCDVLVARSGEEAAELVRQVGLPDGILIDYHLDQGDGIAATEMLRGRFGRDFPAVLITADRSPTVREAARAAGMTVLAKPLKPSALRALLARWLPLVAAE